MKLQYLGDSRDAFKWDLLHWICMRSSPRFDELAFVPMLTPDLLGSNEGNTSHDRFKCQNPFIPPFLISLKNEPRSLERISTLGAIEPNAEPFHVSVFGNSRHIDIGNKRAEYWVGFELEKHANAVVFFDPDNGFETKTKRGTKWIRHSELKYLFTRLPETSVVAVYQHRPQRRAWNDLFADLTKKIDYVHTAVTAYEGNLAFVVMAGNASSGKRICDIIKSYTKEHSVVRHTVLRHGHI
jgi:hypothetical protein